MIPGSANPLLLKSAAAAAGGYQVQRSLRFNSSDSAFCSRTPAVAGDRKKWTWAGWVKRSKLGAEQSLFTCYTPGDVYTILRFFPGDALSANQDNGGGNVWSLTTTMLFRDLSAWYHIVIAFDTTIASPSSDRIKLYVNGSQVTDFSSASYPSQNLDTNINRANEHLIGQVASTSFYSGYLADIHFIDGQALTPSSFTEVSATTGQLIPLAYSGSFGTNGFWLKFSDNSAATAATLGKDYSPNGNNWTPNNLSVTAGAGNDSLVDTPTSYGTDTGVGGEVRGNYATLNPLAKGTTQTLSNGNLDVTGSDSGHGTTNSTIAVTAGSKIYMEFTRTGGGAGGGWGFASNPAPYSGFPTSGSGIYWVYDNGTNWGYHANGTVTEYSTKTTTGQILQLAIDYDAGKAWIGINNTWFTTANATTGNPGAGTNPTFTFAASVPLFPLVESYGWIVACNFGQRAFAYPLSGFKALCDTNLGAPLVAKPNELMDVALYTGNGGTQAITGFNFSPDLVLCKGRSFASGFMWFDIIRGGTVSLRSNDTQEEVTLYGKLSSFDSNGFTMIPGTDGANPSVHNQSGQTYVTWCWDAGTSTVSNPDGSITSQVRANASAGFSVSTWTGTATAGTVGHGLGVAPEFIIVKNRSVTDAWYCYHKSLGNAARIQLNETSAQTTGSSQWNSTSPTSTVYSVGSGSWHASGNLIVSYNFAPVVGYSSFGSYTGNGSADGPFVYTGFRPRYILIKCSAYVSGPGTLDWAIYDTSRSSFNVADDNVWANLSDQEYTSSSYELDILSNGFKLRNTHGARNGSGSTYIYAAFAENPFQYARAR